MLTKKWFLFPVVLTSAFAVAGMIMMHGSELGLDYQNQRVGRLAWTGFCFSLMFMLAIAWHELGHAIAAKARNYTVHLVSACDIRFYSSPQFKHISLSPQYFGYVVALKDNATLRDYQILFGAGPAFTFAGSFFTFAYFGMRSSPALYFLFLFGAANLAMLVSSYASPPGFLTDQRALAMMRKEPEKWGRIQTASELYMKAIWSGNEETRRVYPEISDHPDVEDIKFSIWFFIQLYDGENDEALLATLREKREWLQTPPKAIAWASVGQVFFALSTIYGGERSEQVVLERLARTYRSGPECHLLETFEARRKGDLVTMRARLKKLRQEFARRNVPIDAAYVRFIDRHIRPDL